MILFQKSKDHVNFSIKNNVIFEGVKLNEGTFKVPLFVLKQNFPNVDKIQKMSLEYLEKYFKMFPELYEQVK